MLLADYVLSSIIKNESLEKRFTLQLAVFYTVTMNNINNMNKMVTLYFVALENR